MEPKRSNHFLAHLPTILLLVLFAMSPWLGILFFILRAIDRDAEKKEQTNADPTRDSRAENARTAQSAASGQLRTRFQAFIESLEIKKIQAQQ
jgi:hypothetical protein